MPVPQFEPLPFMKPIEQSAPHSRSYVRAPLSLVIFASVTIFFYLFFAENRYTATDPLAHLVLTGIWGVIYFLSFYWFMGKTMLWLVSRNMPMVVAFMIFFFIGANLEAMVGFVLLDGDKSFEGYAWHVLSTTIVCFPASVIALLYFEARYRQSATYDPKLMPIWLPVSRKDNMLLSRLPLDKRGKILRLKAANQYVEVSTTNGMHEIRETLSNTVKLVPEKDGIQLHRSIWLNYDEIADLKYVKGNPRVVDIHGNLVPVSRENVDQIKTFLTKRHRLGQNVRM
jgi:DNA-binding LytR/AlgR family response regulator